MGKATLAKTPKGSLQSKVEESKPVEVKDSKSAVETKKPGPTSVDPVEQNAILMASKWNSDMCNHVSEASVQKKGWQTKFIILIKDIQASFSKDEISAMPWPGADELELKNIGSNDPYDTYTRPGWINGEYKASIKHSYYESMWAHSKVGAPIAEKLRLLGRDYKSRDASLDALYPTQWQADKKDASSDRTTQLQQLKQAMEIIFQMHAIEGMPYVQWDWVKDAQNNIKNTPSCLCIFERGGGLKTTGAIGPVEFCSYDVAEAIKNGGTMEALKATVKRGKKTDNTTDKAVIEAKTPVDIKGIGGMLNAMAAIVQVYGLNGTEQCLNSEKELNKATNDDDHACLTVGNLCHALDAWWNINGTRYLRLSAAQERERTKEIEMKKSRDFQASQKPAA